MSLFSSLLLVLSLSFAGSAALQLPADPNPTVSFLSIDFNFVLYLAILIGSTKLLTSVLNTYYLSFSHSSCLIGKTIRNDNRSLRTYLECLILYAIFSSISLKETILSYKLGRISEVSMSLLTQLITSILVPFAYISLLVILLSSGINLLNHNPKGLLYKEISIVATSLVLLLSINIVVQNYLIATN